MIKLCGMGITIICDVGRSWEYAVDKRGYVGPVVRQDLLAPLMLFAKREKARAIRGRHE